MTMRYKPRILHAIGIRDPAHPLVIRTQRLRRQIFKTDERIRKDYLNRASVPKLHIGAGWYHLEGWLNTDVGLVPGVMVMDATDEFPFPDETFRFVYTEHMIEHIPYEKGTRMLRECYRVTRQGGVIRVTTPNLAAIVGLYRVELSEVEQRYLSWFYETFLPEGYPCNATSVINAFTSMWGHRFIYDEVTLRGALCAAGFDLVQRRRLGDSSYPALRHLENLERYPEGLLEFESVALEALKART